MDTDDEGVFGEIFEETSSLSQFTKPSFPPENCTMYNHHTPEKFEHKVYDVK